MGPMYQFLRQVSFAHDVEAMPLNRETVVRYFAYLTYPPLYMAGPVITFAEFSEQLGRPRPDMLPWAYAGAWLRLCVFFEALLHVAMPTCIAQYVIATEG